MKIPILYLHIICIIFVSFCTADSSSHAKTVYLQPGSNEVIITNPRSLNQLKIYCYTGRSKYLVNIWQTVFVNLSIDSNEFVQYDGATPEEVQNEYNAHHSSWSLNLFSSKSKIADLNPFGPSCIGIESPLSYSISLQMIRVDYWKILLLVAGILCFLTAPRLSNNPLFYYICGVLFGICASFLVLVYFISKFFPKKPMMYGFVVGGWTIGIYILQLLWENIRIIFVNYQSYVMYYAIGTGVTSFGVCYRLGPPTNPRSKNLIKWTLMGVGFVMILWSSQFKEAAMGIIVILVTTYNIPKVWIAKSRTFWRTKFPPKAKVLSNDEYYEQGVKETGKALHELRTYCSSPECKQWQTVLKLKDAKRFASFIEGSSHLSDNELMEYEQEIAGQPYNDDEDFTDDSSSDLEL